jgi:hypothetical protein
MVAVEGARVITDGVIMENLTKTYDKLVAPNDVSLEVLLVVVSLVYARGILILLLNTAGDSIRKREDL